MTYVKYQPILHMKLAADAKGSEVAEYRLLADLAELLEHNLKFQSVFFSHVSYMEF